MARDNRRVRLEGFTPTEDERRIEEFTPTELGQDFGEEEATEKATFLEKYGPDIIRYGSTIGGGLAFGPVGAAGGALLGETTARGLRTLQDMNLKESLQMQGGLSEDQKDEIDLIDQKVDDTLEAGKAAGAEYLGERWLGPLLAKGWRGGKALFSIGGRPIRRAMLPPLDEMSPDTKAVKGIVNKLGGSLLPDQLDADGFRKWLMGAMRNALFTTKRLTYFDKWNEDIISKGIMKHVDDKFSVLDERQYGEFLTNLMIGLKHKRFKGGELGFVNNLRRELYDISRETIAELSIKFDSRDLLSFYKSNRKRQEVSSVFGKIHDLLPKKKTAEDWYNIPVEDAIEIKRRLNKYLRGRDSPEKGVAEHLVRALKPQIDDALSQSNEALSAYKTAESFYGASADRLENKLMKQLYQRMKDNPSTIVSSFKGKGNIDRYLVLQEAFLGGKLPKGIDVTQLPTKLQRGTSLGEEAFEAAVRKPLQHNWFKLGTNNRGTLVGQKLETLFGIHKAGYTNHLFGKEAREELMNLATALKIVQKAPTSATVWIQLVQGGLFVAAASGGLATESKKEFYGSAAVILFSPVILSRILTSPMKVRTLVKAIREGADSSAYVKAMRMALTLNAQEKIDIPNLDSPDSANFYTEPFVKEPVDTLKERVPSYSGSPFDALKGAKFQ